jgi:hypothetical protein
MYNGVVNFLDKFNLISNAQNGFRKNKSTCTAIQTFIGEVQQILDNRQLAFGIFWIEQKLLMLQTMITEDLSWTTHTHYVKNSVRLLI